MWDFLLKIIILVGCTLACDQHKPRLPSYDFYSVKGILEIPYAELTEPFSAWYDKESGSSRIDYYGGMVKTYQMPSKQKYGVSYKIVPVTTETKENEETCFKIDGSKGNEISLQSIFPDTSKFKYVHNEEIDGRKCEKWSWTEKVGDKINKYIFYVHLRKSDNKKIPVKYEMKGYNTLLGSHYDHYYLSYHEFTEDIPYAVFNINDTKCSVWEDNNAKNHVYTFNPMHEFVDSRDEHMETEFQNFQRKYKKDQDYTLNEHHNRREIFRQNMRYIHSKNRANLGYKLMANHLSDRTDEELSTLRGRQHTSNRRNRSQPFIYNINQEIKKVPETLDWRLFGAVTPVKDQSVCGSCWSFGSTGAIEGAYFLKYDKLITLSQQALIDCSWGFHNNGCDGGEDFNSFEWIIKKGGLPTADDYGPYLAQDGYCHIRNVTLTAKLSGYVTVPAKNVDALKIALFKHGPVSVAIDASKKSFAFYSHGVYHDDECGNTEDQLDHAVLAVGYGTLNGKGYWLVKNSWSNLWGNNGYILISQEKNDCGVTVIPNYVLVE